MTSSARLVLADRIEWKLAPSFDPRPFLTDAIVREAYDDPEVLRRPEAEWPNKPKAIVHATCAELKRLAEKWDALGACRLVSTRKVTEDETVG